MEEVDILVKRPRTTVPQHHPKKYEKTRGGVSRVFESVWMCVCQLFRRVEAVWSVFRFISMVRLAADFTDLLRLEVGWKIWKLVHRRHCGSTYQLYVELILKWLGKVLATLEMKMTATCCAEILLLTSHWDQLGELQVNLANQDATCILPTPLSLYSCFCCLAGGWEPWDPHAHGNLIRHDGRRRMGCKVNYWRNVKESCWSLNAKWWFQANVVKHNLNPRSISWSLLTQWQPYGIDSNIDVN